MNPHTGESLRSFFEELGEWDEVEALAQKEIVAETIRRWMKKRHVTKSQLAKRMRTSRSQVDAILNPEDPGLTLLTLSRVSFALGLLPEIHFRERVSKSHRSDPHAAKERHPGRGRANRGRRLTPEARASG